MSLIVNSLFMVSLLLIGELLITELPLPIIYGNYNIKVLLCNIGDGRRKKETRRTLMNFD